MNKYKRKKREQSLRILKERKFYNRFKFLSSPDISEVMAGAMKHLSQCISDMVNKVYTGGDKYLER